MLARLALRTRLVLGTIVLAALGLAAADVATYTSLRSFLLHRLEGNVTESAQSLARTVGFRGRANRGELEQLAAAVPGAYVGIRTPDGQVIWDAVSVRPAAAPPPAPELPGDAPFDAATIETGATTGSTRYRARLEPLPGGYQLIVAAPLDEVADTLHRLLAIELLVTGGVLLALGGLGLVIVRLGLRPLDEIGETAAAIAAGDLSRRVAAADAHTEVGRLGAALNEMLAQIEAAFTAREASERRLRRFVADASHELRTPLTAIRAYAELFHRGADRRPEDLSRSMSGIAREAERMSVLVDDLLLLARLDEGRPLAREPVELAEVAAEAVEAARAVEPRRPIDVDLHAATVTGDRDRLRQLVDNLLANARTHTPPGTPVHVHVTALDGTAVLEVADEGPGLRPEDAERVFERFFRADASRTRGRGGSGLGLSIVAAVAQAHGGEAAVRSEPGAGASFRVTLPLARDAAPSAPARRPSRPDA